MTRRWAAGLGLVVGCLWPMACGGESSNDRSAGGTGAVATGGAGTAATAAGGSSATGGTGTGGVPSGPLALEDLPAVMAGLICDQYIDCWGTLLLSALGGSDCRTHFERFFTDGEFALTRLAVAEGRAEYHPDQASACVASYSALDCDSLAFWNTLNCEATFSGTVPSGGDCTIDEECIGDQFCLIDSACPGTCTPRSAPGGWCDDEEHCVAGLVCADGLAACVTPLAVGQPCRQDTEPCAPSLNCVGEDFGLGTPGTCTSLADVYVGLEGDACGYDTGVYCREGLFCVMVGSLTTSLAGHCTTELAAPLGPCGFSVPDQCPDGYYCEVDVLAPVIEGVCRPRSGPGEACDPDSLWPTVCVADHRCIEGVCRAAERLGSACLDDAQCYSGRCADGVCVAPDPCADAAPAP